MGAVLAIPAVLAVVDLVVDIGIIVGGSIAVALCDAWTLATITGNVIIGSDVCGVMWLDLATAMKGTFFKRDEGYGALGSARIKLSFGPYDPGHTNPMRVAGFNITRVDNETGIAEFLWSNTTSWQRYGGNMTHMWLNEDGTMKFPPMHQVAEGYSYAWYPNGTAEGTDAEGAPIHGNWTTYLTPEDKEFFVYLAAKKEAVKRQNQLRAKGQDSAFCLHVGYSGSGKSYFYGQDSCKKNVMRRRGDDLVKKIEEEVGYKGDTVLLDSLVSAWKARRRPG